MEFSGGGAESEVAVDGFGSGLQELKHPQSTNSNVAKNPLERIIAMLERLNHMASLDPPVTQPFPDCGLRFSKSNTVFPGSMT